ncbi:MAG TPA: PP2C family serine/threonine-protein phosphatase [Actinokineospora sp.]|nr:PP2C family serine/threonine-protein phosphatase [Actinokineospora sp.]
MIRFEAAAGSVVGTRYRANFDVAHLAVDPLVAVVADGMGDGEGSTRAGRAAVDAFVGLVTADPTPRLLLDAVATAQGAVAEVARQVPGLAGCTLTALVESGEDLWISQIGDSRVYRLRSGLLELLTVDHTMAWLGAVHGWYAFESPQAAAARYHLTRYVGHPAKPEPDVVHVSPRAGDVYLLCTDGVAEQVPYTLLLETLGKSITQQAKVDALLTAADAAGGRDNATAIVVECR